MATHSSILAWRIPETQEPGGLLSMVPERSAAGIEDSVTILSVPADGRQTLGRGS